MKPLLFWKVTGGANDFLLLDGREGALRSPLDPEWVRRLCERRWSVGADGVIVIRGAEKADYALEFYNSDGSAHGFCGNGSRCAVRVAALEKWAGESQRVLLPGGEMTGELLGGFVRLRLPPLPGRPEPRQIEAEGRRFSGFFVDVWNPHFVTEVTPAELPRLDVALWGGRLRRHPLFGREGANVHFAALDPAAWGPDALRFRSYERGVEGETWSCTSGAIACAVSFLSSGRLRGRLRCTPRSGATLTVAFEEGRPVIEGDARVVCRGMLAPDAAAPPPEPTV